MPESLDAFLLHLIADLETGKSVSILQGEATLTTAEAANLLGVSRQFLVRLLDSGRIPHHKVGTHRRLYLRELLAYKAERDGRRRKTLDDLVEAEGAEGLYDRERGNGIRDYQPRFGLFVRARSFHSRNARCENSRDTVLQHRVQ